MQDPDSEAGVLAVLDELAKVGEAALLGLGVLLNDRDDRVGDRSLVLLKKIEIVFICFFFNPK